MKLFFNFFFFTTVDHVHALGHGHDHSHFLGVVVMVADLGRTFG